MFKRHCKHFISAYQKPLVNFVSLSHIKRLGIPNLHTQYSKNNLAHVAASIADVAGIKHTNFEYLSTTTIIASCPLSVNGNYTIKSMLTTSKGLAGTLCGTSKPLGAYVALLYAWHTGHYLQNLYTSVLILVQ